MASIMLTQLRVTNLRVFGPSATTIQLRPITVLCGTNSAGKSTLLKALVMLRQSLSLDDSSEAGRLRTTGAQVDLGDYRTLVTDNDCSRNLHIGVSVGTKLLPIPALWRGATPPSEPDGTLQCDFAFRAEASPTGPDPTVHSDDQVGVLSRIDGTISSGDDALLGWRIREGDTGGQYIFELPRNYFGSVRGFDVMDVPRSSTGADTVSIPAHMFGILPVGLMAPPKWKRSRRETRQPSTAPEPAFFALPPGINSAVDTVRTAISQLHYVAPLRTASKRYQLAPSAADYELDPAGDFVPFVLRRKAATPVRTARPWQEWQESRVPLKTALDEWLYYLRTGSAPGSDVSEYSLRVEANVFVRLMLRNPNEGQEFDLADSGFGYSQVLPIIVRCLLASAGETILIEQPELHLNPALQVRLADFFVAMSKTDRQLVVETHSEHIVNALRVAAAEDSKDEIAQSIAIYFIAQGAPPRVHCLHVLRDGTVPDWPNEFFGEAMTLSSRLLRAQRNYLRSRG